MNNITFDLSSMVVTGVGREPLVFEQSASVPSGLDVTKTVKRYTIDSEGVETINNELVQFSANPDEFQAEEVLQKKYEMITVQLGKTHCYADEFITSEDIDILHPEHLADTGVKILVIHPHGQCRTNSIDLECPVKSVIVYAEVSAAVKVSLSADGQDFIYPENGVVTFPEEVITVIARFENTVNKREAVDAYALLYSEEV